MPYTIDFLEVEEIILIKNTGELLYEDFVKQSQEAIELGRIKNTRLYLSDCTCLNAQAKTLELLDLPALYERHGMLRTSKVAVLMSKESVTNKDVLFYETVCRNRGWLIRVFSDKDAAMEWFMG